MSCSELSLELLVLVLVLNYLFVVLILRRNREFDQEFSAKSDSLEILGSLQNPEEDVVHGSLVSLLQVSFESGAEIAVEPEDSQESANSLIVLLGSFIRVFLRLVLFIQFPENQVQKLDKLEGGLIIEVHQREALAVRLPVESVHNHLDFLCF